AARPVAVSALRLSTSGIVPLLIGWEGWSLFFFFFFLAPFALSLSKCRSCFEERQGLRQAQPERRLNGA
ncbi:MAG: hypothetical protein AB1431_06610, partial [Pseudomonadota bacterium]